MKKTIRTLATLLLLATLTINMVAFAQVVNIKSDWSGGNLVFSDLSGNALLTISPSGVTIPTLAITTASPTTVAATSVSTTNLTLGGTAISATGTELNRYAVTCRITDAGTAGSTYVVCPQAGNIVGISVVNDAANDTTKTVFTAEIANVAVTHPALEEAVAAAAGTAVTVVPTAANAVAAGQAVELISDGGSASAMPCTVTLLIER